MEGEQTEWKRLRGLDTASNAGVATPNLKSPEFSAFSAGISRAQARHVQGPFIYKDLEVWQLSMDLVEACYKTTASFPAAERYGLASQLRRAAVSIPSNIAEGHCRRSTRSYLNHISIALGSHGELRTCLEISDRLGYLASGVKLSLFALSDSVGRLLYGLHHALERRVQQADQARS